MEVGGEIKKSGIPETKRRNYFGEGGSLSIWNAAGILRMMTEP